MFCGIQISDILYFETLDLPLPELQGLKTLKITFHNSKTEEVLNGLHWNVRCIVRFLGASSSKVYCVLF